MVEKLPPNSVLLLVFFFSNVNSKPIESTLNIRKFFLILISWKIISFIKLRNCRISRRYVILLGKKIIIFHLLGEIDFFFFMSFKIKDWRTVTNTITRRVLYIKAMRNVFRLDQQFYFRITVKILRNEIENYDEFLLRVP